MLVDVVLLYPEGMPKCFCHSIPCLLSYIEKMGFSGVRVDSIDEIEEYSPRFVGVSIPFTYLAPAAKQLIEKIKTRYPDIFVLVGGVHVSMCPEEFEGVADFICVGEGEQFIVDVLKGNPPSNGFVDLDEMGLPLWDEPPLLVLPNGDQAVVYSGSRGCPFSCGFCSNHVLSGKQIRFRSIDRVIEDVKQLSKLYDCETVEFRDECFTVNRKRTLALCERLKSLNVKWWCQTRADVVDKELINIMKQSGCIGMSFGVESGNDEILNLVGKNTNRDMIFQAVSWAKESKLYVYGGFIVGFPWDTWETVEETADFASGLGLDVMGCSVMCPYPKTLVRRVAENEGGILTDDWGMYECHHVVYHPPGLEGYDMRWLQRYIESRFYSSSLSRMMNQFGRMWGRKGWKPKVDVIFRMMRWYIPCYLGLLKR